MYFPQKIYDLDFAIVGLFFWGILSLSGVLSCRVKIGRQLFRQEIMQDSLIYQDILQRGR